MALLAEMTDREPAAAIAIRDEIQRRFKNELQGAAGEQFQAADERLMQITAATDTTETRNSP